MSDIEARSFKNAAYGYLAEVGKALSSPARLEILELLAQSPRSVEDLASAIDQSVANTSHHLQTLKRGRLVSSERDGLRVIYSLSGSDVAQLLSQLQDVGAQHVAGLEKLTRDYFDDPEGLEPIDRDTLLDRLRADDVVLVDIRPRAEYAAGHVPGALSMPLDELESRLDDLPRDRTIVAYCRGPYCTFSAQAARRLRELGYDARRSDASVHNLTEARS